MLVDGKKISSDILLRTKQQVETLDKTPRLVAITCAPNFETKKYLEMKIKKASSVGISLTVVELPSDVTTQEVIDCVTQAGKDADGIVVQLPLPVQIDRERVLDAVPVTKDPDGFKYGQDDKACLSPVIGAIDEISKEHKIEWNGKKVVVIGEGRLVGQPAIYYAKGRGAEVMVLNEENFDEKVIAQAEIIISGVGHPNIIKANMVREGSVIFDAGTSEDGGELVGDVEAEADKTASLITPVPGGIGPITIAYLLSNLARLASQ